MSVFKRRWAPWVTIIVLSFVAGLYHGLWLNHSPLIAEIDNEHATVRVATSVARILSENDLRRIESSRNLEIEIVLVHYFDQMYELIQNQGADVVVAPQHWIEVFQQEGWLSSLPLDNSPINGLSAEFPPLKDNEQRWLSLPLIWGVQGLVVPNGTEEPFSFDESPDPIRFPLDPDEIIAWHDRTRWIPQTEEPTIPIVWAQFFKNQEKKKKLIWENPFLEPPQLEENDMSIWLTSNGRAFDLLRQRPGQFIIPKEGGSLWTVSVAQISGATSTSGAARFILSLASPLFRWRMVKSTREASTFEPPEALKLPLMKHPDYVRTLPISRVIPYQPVPLAVYKAVHEAARLQQGEMDGMDLESEDNMVPFIGPDGKPILEFE